MYTVGVSPRHIHGLTYVRDAIIGFASDGAGTSPDMAAITGPMRDHGIAGLLGARSDHR